MQKIVPLEIRRHNCFENEGVQIRYVNGSFVAGTSALSPGVPRHVLIYTMCNAQSLEVRANNFPAEFQIYSGISALTCAYVQY